MINNVEHLLGLFGILWSTKGVYGRFCEGGHICSLPRECCTQGCCPPYQSGPRQLPPASDHVLNLFFISHWYFWCVVVAIILAILCAYSLWKKRRTVCGWGLSDHHAQSEGDSAGSCYAPPQYSRCNSFHHPPPPYTEVTSKPDLYPLVFTCNSDNGKHGASYLMVQYFRNYIIRPAGSLSATSTVDSLSSSFICNANEANTLVPPPYSRATSPDVGGFNSQFQQHFIPRSASQLVCANGIRDSLNRNISSQETYQSRNNQYESPGRVAGGAQGPMDIMLSNYNNTQRGQTNTDGDSTISFSNEPPRQNDEGLGAADPAKDNGMTHQPGGFVQSHSEQYFRYIGNSGNSSMSDIFVNRSCCTVELNDRMSGTGATGYSEQMTSPEQQISSRTGTPAIYSKGCIQTNPLVHRVISNPKQITEMSTNAVYSSNNSIGGMSITVPVADGGNEDRDLNVLRHSLESCCQFLQQQQIQPMTPNFTNGDSPLRLNDFSKKYGNEGLRSYVTSGTCSAVSSLANIGTPGSPPQATSPTGEMKDILDQIRQLHAAGEANVDGNVTTDRTIPQSPIAVSPPSLTSVGEQFTKDTQQNSLTRLSAMPDKHGAITNSSPTIGKRSTHNTSASSPSTSIISNTQLLIAKRPSTLHQNKKKFFAPKPNKALYVPIVPTTLSSTNRFPLKSPVSSVVGPSFFANRSRVRKGWISRSAPSTPATGMPPNRLGDDSPLLNEHDEEQETEHENLE